MNIGLMPCPPKCAKNIDGVWHSAVGNMLSQLMDLFITGLGLKWDYADEFQRQCDSLLAAWVGDYLEQIMVAKV